MSHSLEKCLEDEVGGNNDLSPISQQGHPRKSVSRERPQLHWEVLVGEARPQSPGWKARLPMDEAGSSVPGCFPSPSSKIYSGKYQNPMFKGINERRVSSHFLLSLNQVFISPLIPFLLYLSICPALKVVELQEI